MSKAGWIGLHRKIKEHWIFPHRRKFTEFEAWIYILLHTNFNDSKIQEGNTIYTINRGQMLTSEQKLGLVWLWDRNKVRRFLKMLEDDGMISKKSTSKFTIITICNYDSYQDFRTTTEQQLNINRTSTEHQLNTSEEGKEGKEGKEYNANRFTPPTFELVVNEMNKKLDDFTAQGEAQKFIDFYQSKNWMVGKNKMKDWQAAARGWISRMQVTEQPKQIKITI